MNNLLKEFIDSELNERQIGRIEATVEEAFYNRSIAYREFDGNRYCATIDFQSKIVIINDDLDLDESGEHSISLDEFLVAIGANVSNQKITKL